MRVGTSYYPELVDPKEWSRDLGLMRETGIEVIRMLDFAWTSLEPREGEYHWDWLDSFVDLADEHEMDLIFCTPTASPPAWLATQYPQIMIELRDGTRRPFGARRDADVCSPIYRDYACEIARRMGERYGQHRRLIGWQIDNELCGSEHQYPESHTPENTWRFRRWLRERYGSIEAVNRAWYLAFWNQSWSDWGEVTTPRPERVTPGWTIDYARFFSEMHVEFARLQYDVLRPLIHDSQWITHNSTAMFDRGLDHADMGHAMDVAGWDAYYGAASAGHEFKEAFIGLACDWLRTATRKPIKIMETAFGQLRDEQKLDRYLKLLARHGADLLLIYHWRGKRGNVEQGGGVCDFSGDPRPENIAPVRQAVAFARSAPPAETSRRSAAFIFSVDCYRAHLHRPPLAKRSGRPDYLDAMIPMYDVARRALGPLDVLAPGEPLDGYRVVFAPALRLLDESHADVILDYVSRGGVLFAAGDMAHQSTTGVFYPKPGSPLQPALGVKIQTSRFELERVTVECVDGERFEADGWIERWDETDGEVLGRFRDCTWDGMPALLRRVYGKGDVFFSAVTGADSVEYFLPAVLNAAGITDVG